MSHDAAPSNESTADSARPRRRFRRRWRLLVVLVALALGIRAALPTLVERGVAWGSRQYLGLPGRLDNVDFELLRGRVVLEGLALGARPDNVIPNDAAIEPPPIDPANALIVVERIAARISWHELRKRTLRLSEFDVVTPMVRIERAADGKIDPLRHAQPVAQHEAEAEPEPEAPAEPSPSWKIAVDRFELRSPNVRVVDVPSAQNLAELAFETLTLNQLAVLGNELELGGVELEGPVLSVRRDLLLTDVAPQQSTPAPQPSEAAPQSPAPELQPPVPALQQSAPEPQSPAPAVPTSAPQSTPAEKPGYRVSQIDVQRATFTWISENGPLDVAIRLKASGITTEEGKRFPLDLQLEIGDGRIGVVGNVGILPPTYTGKFNWSGLPIPRILLASLPQYAAWLRQADSNGELEIDADLMGKNGTPALRMAGRLSFDALEVADPKGNEIALGWKQLAVVASEVYAPLPQEGKPPDTTQIVLESVRLVEPTIRYTRPSPQLDALLGLNLSGSAPSGGTPSEDATSEGAEPPAPAAETPAGESPLALQIASLEMIDGNVEAIDNIVQPTARTRVRKLSLEAQQVSYPDPAVANLRFQALLPTSAQLEVQGQLAPVNVGDFALKLTKLDLPVFNPYAGLAGITVNRGSASVNAKLKLRGAKMEIDNRLKLNQLGISLLKPETFEREFGMPIDLALALLRDPKGNIALRIPVKVDEQGSALGLRAILVSALKSALLGAVTAPLKMVGAAFRGEDDSGFALDPLASIAGGSELAGDQGARLDGLVELLAQRPALALALRGRTGPEDHPKLAEQILIEQHQRGEDLPSLEDTSFFARRRIGQALEARAKGEEPLLAAEDQALYERYIAAVAVPDERLVALAKARAERVREELIAKGALAARVVIGENESESQPGVVIGFAAGS